MWHTTIIGSISTREDKFRYKLEDSSLQWRSQGQNEEENEKSSRKNMKFENGMRKVELLLPTRRGTTATALLLLASLF